MAFRQGARKLRLTLQQQLLGDEALVADRLTSSQHAGPSQSVNVFVRLLQSQASAAAVVPKLPLQPGVFGKVLGQVGHFAGGCTKTGELTVTICWDRS